VEIRRASESDLGALRELRLRALTDAPDAFGSSIERELARTDEQWRWWVDAAATFVLVVGDDAAFGGMAAGVADLEVDHRAHLIAMWVAPEHRRLGAASQLVDAVCEWARDRRARDVHLHVADGNEAAERLYERCGFRRTGETFVRERDGAVEHELARRLRPPRIS